MTRKNTNRTYVPPHTRRGGLKVKGYYRKKRPKKVTRKTIGSKPVKLYPIRDQFGQFRGYSTKPPKKK